MKEIMAALGVAVYIVVIWVVYPVGTLWMLLPERVSAKELFEDYSTLSPYVMIAAPLWVTILLVMVWIGDKTLDSALAEKRSESDGGA